MKTIIQLLLAALVLHGCVRVSQSAWRYYQFKDAVEQEARFTGQSTTSELHRRVVDLAGEHGIALEYGDIVVERRGEQTYVAAAYTEPIVLVPAFYTREQLFEFELTVRAVRPLTVDDVIK